VMGSARVVAGTLDDILCATIFAKNPKAAA